MASSGGPDGLSGRSVGPYGESMGPLGTSKALGSMLLSWFTGPLWGDRGPFGPVGQWGPLVSGESVTGPNCGDSVVFLGESVGPLVGLCGPLFGQ